MALRQTPNFKNLLHAVTTDQYLDEATSMLLEMH